MRIFGFLKVKYLNKVAVKDKSDLVKDLADLWRLTQSRLLNLVVEKENLPFFEGDSGSRNPSCSFSELVLPLLRSRNGGSKLISIGTSRKKYTHI